MEPIFKIFNDPAETFYIVEEDPGFISLELGDHILRPSEGYSDGELEQWAEDNYEEEELFKDEEGNFDYEWIRNTYDEEHQGGSNNYATPNGRAFEYIEELDFPADINIWIVDGDGPGNDWIGVECESMEDIVKLQLYLEKQGSRVNFIRKR
jgi:hypothetical protein